uniref:Uncharacterized protein n=1 Tax=Alexandrium catenella TaxID=2925 RepID=A0A7S1S4D1_ALECA|mmetsp:Transcript_85739/g.227846  ORF Transcript_85739/g.227846 Transcript_85739/m.227846 type:complete len:579 (+) Transcript_85739:79-1815(+)
MAAGGRALPAVWLGAAIALSRSQLRAHGALNVGAHGGAEDLVTSLRQSIFVETAYLSERTEERCSSLDGPRCFAALLARGGKATLQGRPGPVLDGPGVLPETLLHDLGVESDLGFITPEYDVLSALRGQVTATQSPTLPVLSGASAALLRSARGSIEAGVLHFAELPPGSRVPLSFSRGLPGNVVATWDGGWRARSRGLEGLALSLAPPGTPMGLPAPETDGADKLANPPAVANNPGQGPRGGMVSVVAELTGSVGYLRFSRPVLVRSLFARWCPEKTAPPGLVGGRLGLHGVWTTHLDPKKLRESRAWIDIGSGAKKPVDEVAFVATAGLEIGAVDVVAPGGSSDEDEEHSVIVLAPAAAFQGEGGEEGEEQAGPVFEMRAEKVTAVASPYIVSLQEVIDRNLRLHAAPLSHKRIHTPGLLTDRSSPLLPDKENVTWYAAAAANQAMFEHTSLMQMLLEPQLLGQGNGVHILQGLLSGSSAPLPRDLQTELPKEMIEIWEALHGWLRAGGGWGQGTPSSLPRNSTEEALLRYVTAKRWQTKLDLITAAYLHQRPEVEQGTFSSLQHFAQAYSLLQQA